MNVVSGQTKKLTDYYSKIYKRYDLINRLFTFGLDVKWRKKTVTECLKENPSKVLDLCCGTGDLALMIDKYSPERVSITGYDLNEEMLKEAMLKAEKQKCRRIQFVQGNAKEMPFADDEFDCITIGFGFRNLVFENPDAGSHLSEIYRVLKQGGKLFILESSIPKNLIVRFLYNFYLYVFLIPLGGLISSNWKAYSYLAKSSAKFYQKEKIEKILNQHGFRIFSVRYFLFGVSNLTVAMNDKKV